jgi:protein-S-isoprenylcysteine O-methyltransferase Ste14
MTLPGTFNRLRGLDHPTRNGVIRYILREYFGVIFLYCLLAGTAGDAWWPEAWALAAVYFTWVTATILVIAPRSPGLLAERAERKHPDAKPWDRMILGIFGILTLTRYVFGGLGARYGWSPDFPLALQVLGAVLSLSGFGIVLWSMAANAWFSTVVRIQSDRNQRVVDRGPYALVRHPGYVGTCLFQLGDGLLLGSWLAAGAGFLGILLMVYRTFLEDQVLQRELPGYSDYARRVCWKLVPGLF